MLRRRLRSTSRLLAQGSIATALACWAVGLGAQNPVAYPQRNVQVVIPYTPGTGADIVARALGPRLAERWKVAVVADNRPGATGIIGTDYVAKAAPDGHERRARAQVEQFHQQVLSAAVALRAVSQRIISAGSFFCERYQLLHRSCGHRGIDDDQIAKRRSGDGDRHEITQHVVRRGRLDCLGDQHAHQDHIGGAEMLQKRYGPHMVMSAPDWELVEKYPNRFKSMAPKRDIVAQDGMKITLGDSTVSIWFTPGHTDGTISYTFQVLDHGRPVNVVYSGGTALVFEYHTPDWSIKNLQKYIDSQRHLAAKAKETGATVLLSNHSEFDEAYKKNRMRVDRRETRRLPAARRRRNHQLHDRGSARSRKGDNRRQRPGRRVRSRRGSVLGACVT